MALTMAATMTPARRGQVALVQAPTITAADLAARAATHEWAPRYHSEPIHSQQATRQRREAFPHWLIPARRRPTG
jgi:hypothetical protein